MNLWHQKLEKTKKMIKKIGMTLAWKTGVHLGKANKQIIKKATNPYKPIFPSTQYTWGLRCK